MATRNPAITTWYGKCPIIYELFYLSQLEYHLIELQESVIRSIPLVWVAAKDVFPWS